MGMAKLFGYLHDRHKHTGKKGAPLIEPRDYSPREVTRRAGDLDLPEDDECK